MKTYDYYGSSPDGWNVSSALELEEDGRFSYSEGWTDYTNASLSGGAGGTWWRDGNVLVFRAERVYSPVYFPWAVGSELRAVEQGDALDFGNGWTLREPGEREIKVPVRSEGERPLIVRLEPWGISNILEPGERLRIVGRGPWGPQMYEMDYGPDEVVYHGWPGSRVDVVYEPKPPAPPVKPPAPPAVEYTPRPAPTPLPNLNPFPVSPELAALIKRRIEELNTEGVGNWVLRLCKEHDALPLNATEWCVWALRTDGQVLVIDLDSVAHLIEPEENSWTAYGALQQGAQQYPELAELLAQKPAGVE
ncbi:MAG: hypothetical protein JOZ96_04390 [Acidobacteria bacterium]|nr:hypothetical protein [Acidobacteriota bacterium]